MVFIVAILKIIEIMKSVYKLFLFCSFLGFNMISYSQEFDTVAVKLWGKDTVFIFEKIHKKSYTKQAYWKEVCLLDFNLPPQYKIRFPESFGIKYDDVFGGNSQLGIESPDGHFVVQFFGPHPFSPPVVVKNSGKREQYPYEIPTNEYYLRGIRGAICAILNDDNIISTESYLKRCKTEVAKRKFNADTLIYLEVPLSKISIMSSSRKSAEGLSERINYSEKYQRCYSVFIHKNDRGYVNMACFFTEEGWRNKEKYIKDLDKVIWFMDKTKIEKK